MFISKIFLLTVAVCSIFPSLDASSGDDEKIDIIEMFRGIPEVSEEMLKKFVFIIYTDRVVVSIIVVHKNGYI